MKMKPELLEHLHASDLGVLAQEAGGRFPLSELQEAARTEEAPMVVKLDDSRSAGVMISRVEGVPSGGRRSP